MSIIENLTGSRIVIYSEDNKELLDTTVLSHNTTSNIINVARKLWKLEGQQRVQLVVYMNGQKLSYKGTIAEQLSITELEIALYKESSIEDREFKRYNLSAYASLEGIYDQNMKEISNHEAILAVRNISSSGIQILADKGTFKHKDFFKLKLMVTAPTVRELMAQVVWEEAYDQYKYLYGCAFIEDKE